MAYAPASNLTTTAGLTHLASVYYNRTALNELRTRFMFWKGVDEKVLPKKNGKTIQFYRYSQLGANTSATSEGTVGTPIEMAASTTVSATVAQYSDFISLSDMLVDTAIDNDIVAKAADQLGYRAGMSCDNIIRAELDSVNGSVEISAVGDYFSGLDLANFRTRMAGLNIKGKTSDAFYPVLAHPYVVYDLIHDPAVGGYKDIVKQTGDTSKFNLEDRGFVCRFNNCEVWETTNTTVTSGSPNLYRAYGFGQEGVAAIDLAGRGPSRTEDQDKTKFSVKVSREGMSVANPEGKIAAVAAYNFVFVVKNLDTNPYRHRQWDFASSLGL